MEQQRDWSSRIAARVGRQVAHFRAHPVTGDKRMSAQALADRCAALGLPLDRAVIAKLEKGLRQTITVGEVLVLAQALGVAPLLLVFPVGQEEFTEVLPGREVPTWHAAKWFAGDEVLVSGRHEETGVWLTDAASAEAWNSGGALPISMYRELDRLADERTTAANEAAAARRAAEAAGTPQERDAHLGRAESEERRVREIETRMRGNRDYLRRHGYAAPSGTLGLVLKEEE